MIVFKLATVLGTYLCCTVDCWCCCFLMPTSVDFGTVCEHYW